MHLRFLELHGLIGSWGPCAVGWFGGDAWITGLPATCPLGGLVALGTMIVRRSREGELPIGPCVLAGTLVTVPFLNAG